MSNLIFGIITVVFCLVGYYLAHRCYKQQNYSQAILMIIICGLALRIFTGSDLYLHQWDEKYHALVAKHLVDEPFKPMLYDTPLLPYSAEQWIGNHIWLEKGPIPLWNCSFAIKLFGLNEIAIRIPSILLSTLAIFLSFLIGKLLFNKNIGLLAAFLHSINGLLIEVAGGRVSSDMVETTFIFFVELGIFVAVYSIYKNRNLYLFSVLIGFVTACAMLCKWSPGLLVIPVWLAGAYFSKKYSIKQLFFALSIITLVCTITFSTWIVYILKAFPEEGNFVMKKFLMAYDKPLEGHEAPFYYYLDVVIRMIFGELIYIPLIISLYFLIRKKVRWQLILLTVWWVLPILIFSSGATKRHTYILICAPAFFLIIAYTWFYLKSIKSRFKYKWLVSFALVLLIALPVRYCIERIKPFQQEDRNPDWAIAVRTIKNKIPSGKNVVVFNVEHNIELMFYNDCIAYTELPSLDKIIELQNKGYLVIINDKANVLTDYRTTAKVIKLDL